MIFEELVLDEADYEWEETERPERIGRGFLDRVLSGGTGLPHCVVSVQPDKFENPAHFHNTPQFQVVWTGSVRFPSHALAPIAVHYTDASVPYGPFHVGPDFVIGVYRPRMANQVYMSDRDGRKERNPYGREFYGQSQDSNVGGHPAPNAWRLQGVAQVQTLISADECGPGAELLRYSADARVELPAAPHGEFQIVAEGAALIDGKLLARYSARWIRGDEPAPAISAGADGLTLLKLTFDKAVDQYYQDDPFPTPATAT